MKRLLAGLLVFTMIVAGIEPVTLKAAENNSEEKFAENVDVSAIEAFSSVEMQKIIEEAEEIAPVVQSEEVENVLTSEINEKMTRATTVASGQCGNSATWKITSDKILYIEGTGAMWDYEALEAPWFDYYESIETVAVYDGITRIGQTAFSGLLYVKELKGFAGVTEIGMGAFMLCASVSGRWNIPKNWTTIEPLAFTGCVNAQGFTVEAGNPNFCAVNYNLFDIDKTVLWQAGYLSDTSIGLPSTVTYIGWGAMAFGQFTSIENSNIQYLLTNALSNCENLKTVDLPSLIGIDTYAMDTCISLESIVIPEGVNEIYDSAFEDCTALKDITFKGNAPKFYDAPFTGVTAVAKYDSTKSGWTSSVRQNYGGSLTWKDIAPAKTLNTIYLEENYITRTVSSSQREFYIDAQTNGGARLIYSSEDDYISVNSNGKVTIPAYYIGVAEITIVSEETSEYKETRASVTVAVTPNKGQIKSLVVSGNGVILKVKEDIGDVYYDIMYDTNSSFESPQAFYSLAYNEAGYAINSLTIGKTYYFRVRGSYWNEEDGWTDGAWSDTKSITVGKSAQKITASNITKTVSSSKRTVSIGAKCKGNAKLTYKSNNSKIKVDSKGKVIIPKNYIGKATITITAAATNQYKKATKKITVTVKPQKASITSLSAKNRKAIIKNKKNIGNVKYQIQFSTNKNFKNCKNVDKLSYSKSGYLIDYKLTKGKTYYYRIRGYKVVNGTRYDGAWSDKKSLKVK